MKKRPMLVTPRKPYPPVTVIAGSAEEARRLARQRAERKALRLGTPMSEVAVAFALAPTLLLAEVA